LRLPAVFNFIKIFFPDDGPESPEKRFRLADDGNFEASAEEELLLVDDALVGADDGASVPLVEVQVGVGGRGNLGGEAEQKSSDHI
jgi:hypothetical protein